MAARKDIEVSQTPQHITFDKKINYKVGNTGKSEVNEAIPTPGMSTFAKTVKATPRKLKPGTKHKSY